MDLSFPGQQTATATSCIPYDNVYRPGPRAGKSENGFFCCDTSLQMFQNDSKICEAEVTVTPLINKICKPCQHDDQHCYNLFWSTFSILVSYKPLWIYVVGQFYSWFKISFSFCFKLIIIHYHTPKQRKTKFKPKIKLNRNIYAHLFISPTKTPYKNV